MVLSLLLIIIVSGLFCCRVLKEYERGVVFTLGRYSKVVGPGVIFLIPGLQQMVRLEIRTKVLDVPPQDVISKDNVSVRVNAVVYFKVMEPNLAVIQVENYIQAVSQLAQTTLRSVLGEHELDEMLSQRGTINESLQTILDVNTDPWGIKVSHVEIKHVDVDESMVRAIARQAEAERERRAKVISAEGEVQAASKLQQAAEILGVQQEAMHLRYLQSLSTITGEGKSTIVFPLPLDLMSLFQKEDKGPIQKEVQAHSQKA